MTGIRARARQELTAEIKRLARAQLAEVGPSGLSLRAISRELGMVSSAIYRYFASRDELLTALIIETYDDVGAVAEAADAAVPDRRDLLGRWRAVGRSVRTWALAHPADYALVYGTPVPGYAAPEDTIGPATRVTGVLVNLLEDAVAAGCLVEVRAVPRRVQRDFARLRRDTGTRLPDGAWAAGLMAWTQLFGTVSFELFGHFHHVIDDPDAYFDHVLEVTASRLGLTRS